MKNKRVLAILLAVCMVLQTAGMDTTAYASESTTDIESFVNETDETEEKEESSELEDMADESDQKREEPTEDESKDAEDKNQDASDSVATPGSGNEPDDPSSPENGDEIPEEGSETEDTETSEDDASEVENTAEEPEAENEDADLPDTLVWEDEENGIQITVSGELHALNGAADLSVKKLPVERAEEYKAVISADAEADAEESEDDGNVKVEQSVYVYDITLLNSDGKEIEPAEDVSVEFSVDEIKAALTDRSETEIEVYHNLDTIAELVEDETETDEKETLEGLNEEKSPEESDEKTEVTVEQTAPDEELDIPVVAESLQKLESEVSEEGVITITTDSFSEYALVLTGKTSQKETSFGDGEYLELDKYLKETGELNNQKTYDVYLENAYFRDGGPVEIKQYAPLGIRSLLITDQSSSMAGNPVDDYNTAIEAYVDRLMEINKARMESARNGEYSDIDPESETLEQDMEDHLFFITGCIGFNQRVKIKKYNGNNLWDVAPMNETEAAALKAALHVKNDLADYKAGKDDTDMADGTKTYLALDAAYNFLQSYPHYGKRYNNDGSTCTVRTDQVVLITDGGPNRIQNAEQVTVNEAQKIKDLGIKIFGVFEQYGSTDGLQAALDAQDITKVSYDSDHGAVTLGMCSSDCPKGGTIGDHSFWPNPDPENTFGKYTNFQNSLADLTDIMLGVAMAQKAQANASMKGYASDTSYIKDTITDPFEITMASQLAVYAVPRIPASLDENNIPVGVEKNKTSPDYGIVSDFVWAEQSYLVDGNPETGWIDITDQVSLNVSGNTVTVTGWDFEKNAVTNYDKDLSATWSKESDFAYKTGDYGYKVVVVIPINAKFTFGGNHIETNNSDTSAFYPSNPEGYKESDEKYLPKWKDNSELNPEGKEYIDTYPVPYVDLAINYKIANDSINVYAPQTAEVRNLVTDTNNYLWYVDVLYDTAKTTYENAEKTYKSAYSAYRDNPDDEDLEVAYKTAYAEYLKAGEKLKQYEGYVPDGINNAYVDIHYSLTDPDGEEIATMDVPHGKPYVEDGSGNGNIDWVTAPDHDGLLKKSGTYKITCAVSPVDTQKAPGGHVSTEADSEGIRNTIPYDSQEYSSTGSSAAGSQSAKIVTETAKAYLYQLKVKTTDTRISPRQTLDFYEGNEALDTTENPHLLGYEWVCTDGITESVKENEPGITGLLQVGDGGVVITNQIPNQARTDGRVITVMGTDAAGEQDGIYIPVGVTLSRKTGNLNKSVDPQEQTTQIVTYMTDDDQIFGEGHSSVIWEHDCDIVMDPVCNENEYVDAQKYGTAADGSATGAIRYLIHVLKNPNPDIHKTTSTPIIAKGNDILWDVVLTNDNETENQNHNISDFTMVDVLPYNEDGRIDPKTNNDGSKFNGNLQYKKVVIDFSDAPSSMDRLKSGAAGLYYTEDTSVRTADETQILGTDTDGIIPWTKLDLTFTGTTAEASVPASAVAVNLTARLAWEEELSINLSANVQIASDQKAGDRYHNQAFVYCGNGGKSSEVVVTAVPSPFISGKIWEDTNSNGLIDAGEQGLKGIVVTLYRKYNPNNGGVPVRVIDGIELQNAYTAEYDKFAPVLTEEDGSFLFEDIQEGIYYIVADTIPDKYRVTQKRIGEGDENLSVLDSEAEELYGENTDKNLDNTAWIKEINTSYESVTNQNIGLNLIRGTVTVGKTVDEIYYPSSMSDEEREDYQLVFHFSMTNEDTGRSYIKSVRINGQNYSEKDGKPQVYCTFEDLPLGTYLLEEIPEAQYALDTVISSNQNMAFDHDTKRATIKITPKEHDFIVYAKNKLVKDPPGGDENGIDNWINVRIPVSLEIKYAGDETIRSESLTLYTFKEEDFEDLIVTYDDGSTISLKEGTLSFDQVLLSPATVTNDMNSGDGKITVSGYYTERGRTVKDNFRVGVDLKPIHKFQLNFDANGSTFDDGGSRNSVLFGYDENKGSNFVTKGVYKDIENGLLNGRGTDYRFAGWNTNRDGTGINYDGLTALNVLGSDSGVTVLTLYARWTTTVTFDAAGGVLSGGTYQAEQALAGRPSGSVAYNVNQIMASGLTANKSNYTFLQWNTRLDGKGIKLEDYGKITGPVTFYAIYYHSDYYYTGTVQTFTAPESGWYRIECNGGCAGVYRSGTGLGGKTVGEFYIPAGRTLSVMVGGSSSAFTGGNIFDFQDGWRGGWNGGANGMTTRYRYVFSGSGGASDVRLISAPEGSSDWQSGLSTRIIVAGGAGGSDDVNHKDPGNIPGGGNGGGFSGQSGFGYASSIGAGASQTYGYAKGQGQPAYQDCSGSGGGGYWGGYASRLSAGGGGGSSYISGNPACPEVITGWVARNSYTVVGGNNSGIRHGHIHFTLVER